MSTKYSQTPNLAERILKLNRSIRTVTILDEDLTVLESNTRVNRQEATGMASGTPTCNDGAFLEVARMICSAVGPEGRIVFHRERAAIVGFQIGNRHVVAELTEEKNFGELEHKVRKLVNNI